MSPVKVNLLAIAFLGVSESDEQGSQKSETHTSEKNKNKKKGKIYFCIQKSFHDKIMVKNTAEIHIQGCVSVHIYNCLFG